MKSSLLLQSNGVQLRRTLTSIKGAQELRIATAYVSMMTPAILKPFARIPKTLLIDYDPRFLTEGLLRHLLTIPNCDLYLADGAAVFHPKVYLIDLAREMHFLAGSSNATSGGLERNVEVLSYSIFSRATDYPSVTDANKLWNQLAQLASTRLTSSLITARRHELATQLPAGKPNAHAPALTVSGMNISIGLPTTLDKVINRETGAAGTQVQFPVDVVHNYFGNDGKTNLRLLLTFGGRIYPVQLTHHRNNTHRIALNFLVGTTRPALLRFKRLSATAYRVDVFDSGHPRFTRTMRLGTTARQGANPYRMT